MATRIYIEGVPGPFYASDKPLISFVSYNYAPMIATILDSGALAISLYGAHSACIYEDEGSVIISSMPLFSIKGAPLAQWKAKK